MKQFSTSNLLLAAFLECGGAVITRIQIGSRYSIVYLNLDYLNKGILENKSNRLGRVVNKVEDPSEWAHLFNSCILGEVEDKYLRLKRRIVDERAGHDDRGTNKSNIQ